MIQRYDVLIITPTRMDNHMADAVKRCGCYPTTLGEAPYPPKFEPMRPSFRVCWHKLRLFLLTQYQAIVALDSDIVVLSNIDELVDKVILVSYQYLPYINTHFILIITLKFVSCLFLFILSFIFIFFSFLLLLKHPTTTYNSCCLSYKVMAEEGDANFWMAAHDETPLCEKCGAEVSGAPNAGVFGLRPNRMMYFHTIFYCIFNCCYFLIYSGCFNLF